jgi:hypothetical protein
MEEYNQRRFLVGWSDDGKDYATMVWLSNMPAKWKGYSIQALHGTSDLFVLSPDGGVIGNAKSYEV